MVVCQYDKITRARNKWKFHLKVLLTQLTLIQCVLITSMKFKILPQDGIMNLNGKDYVFQRANGDAEW